MPDHAYYDELAALSAGGHLSPQEGEELRTHLRSCMECRHSLQVYRDLVLSGLPLTRDAADGAMASPDPGAQERFIARATHEGVRFSPDVDVRSVRPRRAVGFGVAALAVAAALVIAALTAPQISRRFLGAGSPQDIERLSRDNAQLSERLKTRDAEFARQEDQLRTLRTELDGATKTAAELRRQSQEGLRRSTSQEPGLIEELQNREKQLAAASDEISRINQLRITDRAQLDAQSGRLRDVFNQLRVATATLDVERQFAQAGKDILQMLLAKQLRVVDVRDTDVNGRPGAAFARVFLAEGSSIRIFAFDLNDGANRTTRFELWGEQSGSGNSVRSLGSLEIDDRTQNRWSLSIQGVQNLNSIFITASTRASVPEGPRLLYASLGQPAR